MAKPDLKDGFVQLPWELMAALALAGFNRGSQLVLLEVFTQVYGLAQLRAARLSPTEMARRSGMHKQHVSRAIQDLVKAGLIVKVGSNLYKFNPDHESWDLPGESPEDKQLRVSCALSAPALVRSYISQIDKVSVTKSGYTDTTDKQKPVTRSGNALPDLVTKVTNSGYAPAAPHIRNGRAELRDTDTAEQRCAEPATPPVVKSDLTPPLSSPAPGSESPAPCPPYPDPEGPLEVMPGAHSLTPDDTHALWRMLWASFQDVRLCNQWYEHQRWYPAEVWRAAIRVVARRGIRPQHVRYLERVAGSLTAEDLRPDAPPPATSPGAVRRVTTPTPPVYVASGPAKRVEPAAERIAKSPRSPTVPLARPGGDYGPGCPQSGLGGAPGAPPGHVAERNGKLPHGENP